MLARALAWILVACPLAAAAPQDEDERPLDTVVLEDGEELEGHVLREGDETLLLLVGSREREIPTAKVAEVRSVARSMVQLLRQYSYVDTSDPRQMLDLARFSRSRGLAGLAELFALRALESSPDDVEAHEFLGHRKRKQDWEVRVGNTRVDYSKLEEFHGDWSDPWEIRTPHYHVRTNLRLREALDVAMDLELLYREFYDRFGGPLALREIVQRMPAHVHADAKSFPEFGNQSAYFMPDRMTIFVNAERGYLREFVMHEAIHQLLYGTAVSAQHTPDAKGCLPAWLDEGLATYFQVIQTGPFGHVAFDDRKNSAHFTALHRTTDRPYDLSRVLTFSSNDFHASSRVDLKYAQCYTLVEFWLRGDFFLHRESFFDVMRRAYQGNCSASDAKRAMTIDDVDFEAAWNAHVGRAK
jgi:hypothetical protein